MENERLLRDLLKQKDETVILDFKREITLSSDKDKNEFARDVSAFANTKGGHILFGKEDPEQGGRVLGIRPENFDSAQMQQIITNRCHPPVNFDAELMRVRNKWFGLLTIPESAAKPHEIIGTWDVWVRRGKTTGKATDRERMLMRQEAERKSIIGEEQLPEKTSDKYRGKAFTSAFVVFFLMIFLPFRLLTFWIFGHGLDMWINIETIFFIFAFVAILAIGAYFFEHDFSNSLLSYVRRFAAPYLFSFAVFVLVVCILNSAIFLYPETLRVFFQISWQDFFTVCILLVLVLFAVTALSYFPITEYFSALKNEEYVPNPKSEMKYLIEIFRRNVKMFRAKIPALVSLAILIFAVVIVPADLSFGLFTPSYRNDGETFSHSYYSVSDNFFLFIYSSRISPELVQSEYRFYRLVQTQYTIYPAKLPLLNLIRIPDPTNVTLGGTQPPSIGATSSEFSQTNIGYVSVDVSKSINYAYVPKIDNFTDVEFNVSSVSEPLVANFTYWKPVNANVSITNPEPEYDSLENGTWLEKYTFLILNSEQIPLTIMAWDFDRFMFQVVNATTTKTYSQGQEWPVASFVYLYRRLGIWDTIGPGYSLNLTIAFQSSDIS